MAGYSPLDPLPTSITAAANGHLAYHNGTNTRVNQMLDGTFWRDVGALLLNGWTVGYAGRILIRRVGNRVELFAKHLDGTAATSTTLLTIPAGFRNNVDAAGLGLDEANTPIVWQAKADNTFQMPLKATSNSAQIFTWWTIETFPSALPGTGPTQP